MVQRRSYDWTRIINAGRKKPGRWFVDPQMVNAPARLAASIRLRRHPLLRVPDGRLEVDIVSRYVDDAGTERGTVWLRFIPTEQKERPPHGQ